MIIGLGIDIVEIDRIRRSLDRFGERFIEKILHESEAADLGLAGPDLGGPDLDGLGGACPAQGSPAGSCLAAADLARAVPRVAARFAAKEAGVKALGTGFSAGIGPRDIRVLSLPSGQPSIAFHGKALEHAEALGVHAAHVSISHGRDTACAVVVLERQSRPS